jgi:hypothetical protein
MIFLVFEPKDGLKNARADEVAERIVFLREKFSWPALFFGPLWLLWHRLWLGLVLWSVVFVAASFAVVRLGLGEGMMLAAFFVPSLLVAFEATTLRRRKLQRQGWRDAGVVIADNLEIAEHRFFDHWLVRAEMIAAAQYTPPVVPAPQELPPQVIGLFPEAGAPR